MRMPLARVMDTASTVPSRDRTAPLHAAAAVVPVLNPRRSTCPLEFRTARPCSTNFDHASSFINADHSGGYSKPVTGSFTFIDLPGWPLDIGGMIT